MYVLGSIWGRDSVTVAIINLLVSKSKCYQQPLFRFKIGYNRGRGYNGVYYVNYLYYTFWLHVPESLGGLGAVSRKWPVVANQTFACCKVSFK